MTPYARKRRRLAAFVAPVLVIAGLAAAQTASTVSAATSTDRAQLYAPHTYTNTSGDVWSSTWADDGNLYSISDDTGGWNGACSSNFAINTEIGSDPLHLTGKSVNCMNEYGGAGQSAQNGYNWKAESIISVDGTLYASIGNMIYQTGTHRQYIMNSTIIKSTDHGQTWTPSETQNYNNPMFPDQGFAPFFIQYGQDDNPAGTADGGDQYIYAISNNGFYNSGDETILGRVPRSKIGNLNGADWQFYKGGPGGDASSWGTMDQAAPILTDPRHLSSAQVQYDAALHKYLLIQWYWTYSQASGGFVSGYNESAWDAYEAPSPWGPWSKFYSHTFTANAPDVATYGQGWYGSSVPPKFMSPDGRQLYVFAANLVDRYALNVFPFVINGGTAPPAATLSVPQQVVPGDSFQASVTVHNTDTTNQVHNVSVSLPGPPGWTITPQGATQTVVLAPGADFTVKYNVSVPSNQQANITERLAGTLGYTLDGNNISVAVDGSPISVVPPIQIVSFTASPDTVQPGQQTTFQAVLRNRGHSALSGPLTINGPAGWTITPSSQDYNLAVGAQKTFTATTTNPGTTGQTLKFTASTTYDNGVAGDHADSSVFTGHLRCLLGYAPQEVWHADPGYGCTLDQGYEFYDTTHIWPASAPANYCWCAFAPPPLLFHLTVPARVNGTVRLFIVDGDNFQGGRDETIVVDGHNVGTFSGFQQGKWVEANVTAADTADGRINVEVDNARQGSNVVVSEVDF